MAASEAPRLTRFTRDLPWSEPVDALRRLRDHPALPGAAPQLLDGLGAHPEARHAYVALHPAAGLELRGDTLTATHGDRVEERTDVLAALREWTERFRFDVDEGAAGGFTGGWVGLVGYEFVRHVEPTLPARDPSATTPDLWLRLCRDALVFDRARRTVRLYAHDLPGETGAEARLDAVAAALDDAPTRSMNTDSRDDVPSWETSLDRATFEAAVARVVDLVKEGDLFQANLATRFRTPSGADPTDLFERLATANPSPYMALLDGGDWQVVSCSPEQLFAVDAGVLRTRPIAGTRARGADDEADAAQEADLLADPKERAEHTMLVDLLRNDVAKVSVPGTVRVPERMSVERYRHVLHLVSRVEGDVRPGTGFVDWLCALFPGGTITGAPKHRACLRIHEAEPVARGPYTGSAGFLSWSHHAHWNILIRTLVLERGSGDAHGADGTASVHAGSGIVADSDPAREWVEAGHKARALLEAATGGTDPGSGNTTRIGDVTPHGSWAPPPPPGTVAGRDRRVLLVDNYDSFTHNLADYLAALGADVRVVRNDEDWRAALAAHRATHVVLSPGPGRPEDSGATLEVASELVGRLPVLGVCLGHQALALAAGGTVEVGAAVHGKSATLHSESGRLLEAGEHVVGRYHSLVVRPGTLPPSWRETAWLPDGTLMAFEHREHPVFGFQYHPESISTPGGLETLLSFLET